MKRFSPGRTLGALALVVPLLLAPATAAPAAPPVSQVATVAHAGVVTQTLTGRGGSSGSSSGGGRSVSGPSRSSGGSSGFSSSRSGRSGSSSGGGRGVSGPRNSNGKSSNYGSSSTSSSSKKGNGGGGLFGSSSSKKKNNAPTTSYGDTSKVSRGKVSVPSSARVTNRTYNENGYTYVYNRSTYHDYYVRYHVSGGYPAWGTPLYWQLLNDPFYYPNYVTYGSPWYHHAYPAGFVVQNGDFVAPASYDTPVSTSGHGFGHYFVWFLFWLLIIGGLLFGAWFVLRHRPRKKFGGYIR
jgi:hypothetical protein